MTLSPLLGMTLLADGQAAPEVRVNENDLILEFFANGSFKSRTTTAEPGSPANGDGYLVPASATGTHWAGQDGKIALFVNTAWKFFTAKEGMKFWVNDEDVLVGYNGSSWGIAGGSGLRLIAFFFTSAPTASEVLALYIAADAFAIPANMGGTKVAVGSNPGATFAIDVQRALAATPTSFSTIATISISIGGVVTLTTTSGGSKAIAPGDVLKFVAPSSADGSIANVAVNVKGTL